MSNNNTWIYQLWSQTLSLTLSPRLPFQTKGMCQPRKMGTVGAEPFSAKLRYTGTDDPQHPNLIKVTVTMPHIDGRWELEAGPVPRMKCDVVCV